MRVTSFITSNKPIFRGYDDNVIAYDDTVSQERRKYIRENYEYENMPYQSLYEKEPRLEEYQLTQMLNFFAKKPKKIDGDIMSQLPLYNVHNISNSYRYKPNIYRGSTLYDASDDVLDEIKSAGIKTVINLADYGDSYKEKIEKSGLRYFDYDIDHFVMNKYADENDLKDKLVEFIQEMQKEYVYMGCEYGTYKTDSAVYLNTLFNPKVKGYCKIYSPEMISHIGYFAEKMYSHLTQEDKDKLGWTPEFEAQFIERVCDK